MTEKKELYEIDVLDTVYQLLTNDEDFTNVVGKESIFKYHIPEEYRDNPPVVRITGYQTPTQYGDGEQLGWYGLVQVDIWNDEDPHKLGMDVNRLMKRINFKQTDATPELDPDTYLIRNGKRFEGIIISDISKLINS